MTEITDLDRAEARLRDYAKSDITIPSVRSALDEVLAALDDARRWQALMNTARFRIQGSAGLDREGKRQPGEPYIHFGIEVWSAYRADGADGDNARARNMLTALAELTMMGPDAEAAIQAEKEDVRRRMDDFCLILGKDIRAIVRELPNVGLLEAIAQSGRDNLDPARTANYLYQKKLVDTKEAIDTIKLSARGHEVRAFLLDHFEEEKAVM